MQVQFRRSGTMGLASSTLFTGRFAGFSASQCAIEGALTALNLLQVKPLLDRAGQFSGGILLFVFDFDLREV